MWWLLRTAVLAGLAAWAPYGVLDALLVALAFLLAIDWEALLLDQNDNGSAFLAAFICLVAALFAHGGAVAAALVTIAALLALALPRRERERPAGEPWSDSARAWAWFGGGVVVLCCFGALTGFAR